MNQKTDKAINCDVYNGDTLVGVLTRLSDDLHTTVFEYDPAYNGPSLNLSMPKNRGPLVSDGLHPFFCNLISEGWLEETHKRILDAKQKGEIQNSPTRFDILAYFGRDCIGSIRIEPREKLNPATTAIMKDMGSKLAERNNALVPGVQPKILAIKNSDGGFCVSTRKNKSTHIAKLPHDNRDLYGIIYNEFVTTEIFRALLPEDATCNVELADLPGYASHEHVLLIERFDRTRDGKAIEFYEFNQLLNKDSEEKYSGSHKEIADFIRSHAIDKPEDGIKTNLADIDILFKRILGIILIENGDAHLKNFALLKQGGEFRLSPNYDMVSCSRYKTRSRNYSHMALAIGGREDIYIPSLVPKQIFILAKDLGILSQVPTVEEVQKISSMISALGQQVMKLKRVLETKIPLEITDEFSRLQAIQRDTLLAPELNRTLQTIGKRWNGTLAGTEYYLQQKMLNHSFAADKPKAFSSLFLGLHLHN